MTHPYVSIVIPTRDRISLLQDCIHALIQRQTYPNDRFEIIVVDDGSVDGTPGILDQLTRSSTIPITVLKQERLGVNAARNAGIQHAKGDPIVFIDDDVETPPGWLQSMIDGVMRYPQAACLGGPVKIKFEGKPPRYCEKERYWREAGELDYGATDWEVPGPDGHVNSSNMATRRWAFDRVGLFNADLMVHSGDEIEWQHRLHEQQLVIMYVSTAWLWHRRTAADLKVRRLLRRRFLQGVKYARYCRYLGKPVYPWALLGAIPFYLIHAGRRRCFGAVLEAVWKLGVVWEWMWGKSRVRETVV